MWPHGGFLQIDERQERLVAIKARCLIWRKFRRLRVPPALRDVRRSVPRFPSAPDVLAGQSGGLLECVAGRFGAARMVVPG